MFTITTTQSSNGSGTGTFTAKGHGRQRTVKIDHAMSADGNHGAAVGALLNVLCDDRQRAMLRTPSGGQRVRNSVTEVAQDKFKTVWTISV